MLLVNFFESLLFIATLVVAPLLLFESMFCLLLVIFLDATNALFLCLVLSILKEPTLAVTLLGVSCLLVEFLPLLRESLFKLASFFKEDVIRPALSSFEIFVVLAEFFCSLTELFFILLLLPSSEAVSLVALLAVVTSLFEAFILWFVELA